MKSSVSFLQSIMEDSPQEAWQKTLNCLWDIFSADIDPKTASSEIVRRERSIESLELLLASAAWELWHSYPKCVDKASDLIVRFWERGSSGKAILILDGLSLREAPFILGEAQKRGYKITQAAPCGIQLPPDTNHFAQSLGFPQRSSLENNRAGKSHKLKGAVTESSDLPWRDCVPLISSHPTVVFWHHWPDCRIHDFAAPGRGVTAFTLEADEMLSGDDFWAFVERLGTGRKIVITSDHGYAACGLFPDITEREQVEYLKGMFKSGRMVRSDEDVGPWLPPITLPVATAFGKYHFVLGRKKWKSAGGYPTLAHGGLSLLETVVPFIELEANH